LAKAEEWANARDLSAADDPSYLREFEHLTLARLLIAQYRASQDDSGLRQALALLDRLLTAAEAGGRTGSANEILMLQALAHQGQGHVPAALASLERALAQAEPEGYVRLLVDEGAPMAALLQAAAQRGIAPEYVRRLLGAFGQAAPPAGGMGQGPARQPLLVSLSERELEVLRLLRTELSGPEIARQLMVSLNTFHTHTKNIYSKLEVNNRQAAVRRAEELNLS
jgi:LuxR family maltose regulon positive regulatory protein